MPGAGATKDKRAGRKPESARPAPVAAKSAPAAPAAADAAAGKLGRRRKKQPRSSPPPEVELDADTLEFIAAIERYRKVQSRPFPSWSEVLHVLRQLGYRKA